MPDATPTPSAPAQSAPAASAPAIVAEQLTRRFGEFVAVRDVSFKVARGEIFGYLGANGAGKSTTIRMLCGLLAPTAGRATVAGADVARDPERVKRAIGYMSQRFSLYLDLRVRENLEFFGGAYGLGGAALARRIDALLERVELAAQGDVRTGDLPGGLRQRVALIAAMLHEPAILFLDEPTAGVAPAARRTFWRLIRELAAGGTTVFVTTHYMDEAEYCHRIGMMTAGRLVALDTPAALKREHLAGSMFLVEGPQVAAALPELRRHPGVLGAQPFGAAAHLRVDPARLDGARLQRLLADGAHGALRARSVEPSLEDVFLALVEER
ncbi:MAG: ABC transporter ATP-binding protein [Proteobacteria bacterium]|nr:ABC transporter ATP-binding protein [Pseudomonadota bacterium]